MVYIVTIYFIFIKVFFLFIYFLFKYIKKKKKLNRALAKINHESYSLYEITTTDV